MSYRSLAEFVNRLRAEGELIDVSEAVDPALEVTELADRMMKQPDGGKALLFSRPKRGRFPLLINAFGSRRRLALALGERDVDELARDLGLLLRGRPPTDLRDAVSLLNKALGLRHARPRRVAAAPCQEVVSAQPDLGELPVQTCWPQDGGPFVTLPLVFSRDPDSGERNVGMYRMQVYDHCTTGMHWQRQKTGRRHLDRYRALGRRMEVAVALGGDPVYTFCATAPLPDGVDELLLAGYLRRERVPLTACRTIDMEVPADCDFVLEGYVDPAEAFRTEGPFGDHTGWYSLPDDYPVFHVTCMTHRRDPIYPCTIVGAPPMEDYYLGEASARLFMPVLRMVFPEIVDLHLPAAGVFHNLVLVSIRKQYPYHAYKVMSGLWGMGQMSCVKAIVVLDDDVDLRNGAEVAWRLLGSIDPRRDILLSRGPADTLDHATERPNIGSKIGIDATTKWKEEGFERQWPPLIRMTEEVRRRMDPLWELIRRELD